MTPPRPRHRSLAWLEKNRFAIAQLVLFVALVVYPNIAQAYMGETFLNNVATYIIAPLALFMILATLATAMVKPDMAKGAAYVAIVAVVLFGIIKLGGTVIGWLQNTGANS